VSYDFHNLSIAWVSESSQWWRSMAVVVAWGLTIATFLTLVVVPSMYYLLERSKERSSALRTWLHATYWGIYLRLFGEDTGRR
jgi:Cu/Ag efflux pump CusA